VAAWFELHRATSRPICDLKRVWALRTQSGNEYVRFVIFLGVTVLPITVSAQVETASILPIRPLSFDAIVRDQTFAPKEHAIELQAGLTAFWWRDLEVRTVYRFLDLHSEADNVTQHIVFFNPRWNNFIDILDFPASNPINQLLRHAFFGPLEHRVVPYLGGVGGMVLPGPNNDRPEAFYGGQLGVRVLLTEGISLDVSLEYSRFRTQVDDENDEVQRWLMTIGIRF